MNRSHHSNNDTPKRGSHPFSDKEEQQPLLPFPAELPATLKHWLSYPHPNCRGGLFDEANVTSSRVSKFVPKPSNSLKTDTMALALNTRLVAFPCENLHTRERLDRGFVTLSKTQPLIENRGRNCHRVRCSAAYEEDSATAVAESSTCIPDFWVSGSEVRSSNLRESPCAEKLSQFVSKKMNRRAAVLNSAVFLAAGGGFCACCNAAMAGAEEDWSYGDTKWGGSCAIGAQQSPIDVQVNKAMHGEALGELQFEYKLCTPTFKNPGHGTIQVNFAEGVNKLRVNGRELNLVQFHFHAPSEHAFDGVRFPMEAHLVHQDVSTKAYAVVGVMLDATADVHLNGALAAALQYSPLEHGKTLTLPNVQVSANDLLPLNVTKEDRRYVHYLGSFTTPPCTESVDWFLLEKALRVSTSEVVEFMKFVGDEQTLGLNARPLQPLGDREVFEGP